MRSVTAGPAAVIDSLDVGPDLPPQGHSLFDQLVHTQDSATQSTSLTLAFPFSALLEQLRERLGVRQGADDPFTAVLLPVGRSLQRHAAAPDFFRSPRVVAAVTTDSTVQPARDHLYIGYQEQTGVLEIISYNETLGRFEFQIVKDYRAGGKPQLYYAKRMICMACHQNQAPIFSRPLWNETNANAAVAARLRAAANDDHYNDIPLARGIDAPDAIDNATDRANRVSAWQRVWASGCEQLGEQARTCRRQLLDAALRLRLSGWQAVELENLAPLRAAWQRRWPEGLALPNADIPNHDPLADTGRPLLGPHGVAVPADVDPLRLRASTETLDFGAATSLSAVLHGLAGFFNAAQIEALDAQLHKNETQLERQRHTLACSQGRRLDDTLSGRIDVQCAAAGQWQLSARLYLDKGRYVRGLIDRLQKDAESLVDLDLQSEIQSVEVLRTPVLSLRPRNGRLGARLGDGRLLRMLELHGLAQSYTSVELVVHEQDDYAQLRAALHDLQVQHGDAYFSNGPYRPAALVSAIRIALGTAELPVTLLPLPAARLEPYRSLPAATDVEMDPALIGVLATLQRYCAACHASAEDFPPNFLSGSQETVLERLAECAERIDHRLAMWSVPAAERDKSPMPPALLVADADRFTADPAWLKLREYISTLRATRSTPAGDAQPRDYEQLAPCRGEGG